jgi:hypothetical protein
MSATSFALNSAPPKSSNWPDYYFAAWALVLPISSVLVVPFIQGTTPAYLFALALLMPPVAAWMLGLSGCALFYRRMFLLLMAFIGINALAQLALSASGIWNFGNIELVDPFDRDILLRRTLITQSMYMLAAGSTFVYVWSFYKPAWDRWLLMGVTLLGAYGIYELLFFALTGFNGDILTNRRFGSSSGSAFQTIAIGPLIMERLKSLTGEPSMYAFTVLPFCIYAWHVRHRGIAAFLLLTLLLSTSTTAVIGLVVYLLLRLAFYGPTDRPALFFGTALLVLLLLGLAGNQYINDAYMKIVSEKMQSASGESRLLSFQINLDYFLQEPLLTQIFGIGFGYARATNMCATLLINLGVLGVLLTTAVFMIPVFRLGPSERERGLKAAVLVIFITMMGSVPEFSYLSIWVFLGMAYHALAKRRRDKGPALGLNPGLQS